MNTDPISDFLTRIRNANLVGKTTVKIPYSNIKSNIANILKEEGFITSYQVENEDSIKNINLNLSYKPEGTPQINGLKRISKPGLRIYSRKGEIPRYYGDLGVTIVSTSKGIMTDNEARNNKIGGEIICKVF